MGLRETFDVAKRIGLLAYIAINTQESTPFLRFLQRYRHDFNELETAHKHYRNSCENRIARKILQSGLVRIDSIASLNKYVRVAGELGLIDFNYTSTNPNNGILIPNHISKLASIIYPAQNDKSLDFTFELNPLMKKLMFELLLQNDRYYILPMIYAIKELNAAHIKEIRRNLPLPFTKNLLFSLKHAVTNPHINPSTASLFYQRIPFILKNLRLLEMNAKPKRGITHLIDPRIHWIYDLTLVDFEKICKSDTVEVSSFWNLQDETLEEFIDKVEDDLDAILIRYSKSLLGAWDNRSKEDVIEESIGILAENYEEMIPIQVIILLAKLLGSSSNIRINNDILLRYLKGKEYPLYRNYEGSIGYLGFE